MTRIEYNLAWPPTVNHYYAVYRGRKIKSAEGRRYLRDTVLTIHARCRPPRLTGPVSLRIVACPPDKRRRDLDNLLKPVLDAFTSAGVYLDDSQVHKIVIERGELITNGALLVTVSGRSA